METTENEYEELCNVPFIEELLSSNLNICDEILDAYYHQVPQPTNRNQIPDYYVGKLNRYYSPYQVSIYGAFPLMSQWSLLEYKMDNCTEEYFKPYQKEKVFESLKEFAKGFQHGYDNFIKEKIDDTDLLTSNETSKVQVILDFLSSPFNRFGFSQANGKGRKIFSLWNDDGIKAGYIYRAWVMIIKNHKLFEPAFKASPPVIEMDSKIENKDFTTSRQVMAILYILNELQVKNVDNTEKARFVQFLTGKEIGVKRISDTNIYKKIKNPLPLNDKVSTRDLQFVREYFEKLGLTSISKKISKEIGDRE